MPNAGALLAAALLVGCAAAPPRATAPAVPVPAAKSEPAESETRAVPGSAAEFNAWCEAGRITCRRDVRVQLRGRGGELFDHSWRWFQPAVEDPYLTILPGEKLHVEARVEGDRLVLERAVTEVTQPERTLELSFVQTEGEGMMMLTVRHPFPRALKYEAGMFLLEELLDPHIRPTSSCAVMPGIEASETWPDPIFQLVMREFQYLASGSSALCR